MTTDILFERTGGWGVVTLNRPQVNNAYNGDLIQGLHDAMDALGRERPEGRRFALRWTVRSEMAGDDV